jgi:DNA-binding GntR family transcriptional regulator
MSKPKTGRRKAPADNPKVDNPKSTGAQRVYEALRHAIIALDLAPGAALDEGPLCRHYKVSRTPVREALIRLASEDLVELQPNRGAKVASLQFLDVVDHYEAMDIFLPVTCHFAAVRRTDDDLAEMSSRLETFRLAVARKDGEAMIQSNYDLHWVIAAACHNRSLEKAYHKMLVDKLRIGQHGVRGSAQIRDQSLAERFQGTLRISEALVHAIGRGDGKKSESLARDLNNYVRQQVIELLSASLGKEIQLPGVADKAVDLQQRLQDPGRTRKRKPAHTAS